MKPDRRRIEFLDHMRVFAFLSVLVGHKFFDPIADFASNPSTHPILRSLADLIAALCMGGGAGVIVFFLTSGYIITYVLRFDTPAVFMMKRVFRIYPLYIFAVVLQVALDWWVKGTPVPEASVMIPRMLLIGDFFGTPYALGGVEWTLRVEVMFYVFMAALKKVGAFERPAALPPILVGLSALMATASPFPVGYGWSDGYFFIFAPYLFVGAVIYLVEERQAGRVMGACCIAALFLLSMYMLLTIQPRWNGELFPLLAMLIFTLAWLLRHRIVAGRVTLLLSSLTFSVYVLHNWLWEYIADVLSAMNLGVLPMSVQVIVILFGLCYLTHRYIEQPMIRAGSVLLRALTRPTIPDRVLQRRTG